MGWGWFAVDCIPFVGGIARTVQSGIKLVQGDVEGAKEAIKNAGMNFAGDALGVVTGGAGKVAAVAGRTALKVAEKKGFQKVATQMSKVVPQASTKSARVQAKEIAGLTARDIATGTAVDATLQVTGFDILHPLDGFHPIWDEQAAADAEEERQRLETMQSVYVTQVEGKREVTMNNMYVAQLQERAHPHVKVVHTGYRKKHSNHHHGRP